MCPDSTSCPSGTTRPPLPPDGLQIGRDEAGTWRTYQARYPASTLTSGHASNVEAYWACHGLRDFAPWALVVDIRLVDEDAPQDCEFERKSLAGRVDRRGEDYARWRRGPQGLAEPEVVREVRGVEGLHLERYGRGDWAVARTDGMRLANGIGTQAKATVAARAFAALADWNAVPAYVLPHLPALVEDAKAIKWEAYGDPAGAESARLRAKKIRAAVAEKGHAAAACRWASVPGVAGPPRGG
jgi:hypothetical protein